MTALSTVSAAASSIDGASESEPVLEINAMGTTFLSDAGEIPVLHEVSFTLHRGRTLILLGESGSGKSVTIRSILRLYADRLAHHSGEAIVDGTDVLTLGETSMRDLRGPKLSMVQQDPMTTLDPLRRIGAQIEEALLIHHMVSGRREARGRAEQLLDAVGIADAARVLRSYPHQISGGMRQRVAIAIAVSSRPEVILADEPTSALDVTVQAQVLDLFRSLQKQFDMALLMITHDVGVALELGGDVAVMYAGRIVEYGATSDVLGSPRHPYTKALLDALPTPDIPRGQLRVIPGRLPTADERLADACTFAARCGNATAECFARAPRPVTGADGRRVSCHNPVPVELGSAPVELGMSA